MDTKQFDALAQIVGITETRRVALRSALGLGLTGVLGERVAGVASAAVGCTKLRRRCRHHRQCCSLECRQGRCRR
jgi:hypothetical protein